MLQRSARRKTGVTSDGDYVTFDLPADYNNNKKTTIKIYKEGLYLLELGYFSPFVIVCFWQLYLVNG